MNASPEPLQLIVGGRGCTGKAGAAELLERVTEQRPRCVVDVATHGAGERRAVLVAEGNKARRAGLEDEGHRVEQDMYVSHARMIAVGPD